MEEYVITCLTYKRKKPKIFKLLKDNPDLVVHFGVRREEFDNGFYDSWKGNPQIKFIMLDECHDAGDTRNKILTWAYDNDYQYCVQLDDTVTRLYGGGKTAKQVVEEAMKRLNEAALQYGPCIMGVEFIRKQYFSKKKRDKAHWNFIQAWMIDLNLWYNSGIRFRSPKDVGWDDFVFSWEVFNANYACLAFENLYRSAGSFRPFKNQAGGTHEGELLDTQSCIKINNDKCKKALAFVQSLGAKNCDIRQLNFKGISFDYVHATWEEKQNENL